MFKHLFRSRRIIPRKRTATTRQLIRREAAVGGKLFGPIPTGHSRQFFCLDEHSWVWHESWKDEDGQLQNLTTRYEVRPSGILKTQGNQPYHYVGFEEANNLIEAMHLYGEIVPRQVYGVGS